jgi:hypothetical protein
MDGCTGVQTEPLLTRADANLAEDVPDPIWSCRRWAAVPRCHALVSGVSKRVRANVPAPKEEHSCQTSENDRAFIA